MRDRGVEVVLDAVALVRHVRQLLDDLRVGGIEQRERVELVAARLLENVEVAAHGEHVVRVHRGFDRRVDAGAAGLHVLLGRHLGDAGRALRRPRPRRLAPGR